ncbi:hypothetical protein [Sorangium sp. So ce1335]|uniref:hypothetical protein n=1 Tax=Sorangium sp. So ce1335 TaxID=3133335 RepID=UPI003F636CD6
MIVFKPPAIDPVWSLRRGRRSASVPVRGRFTVSAQELALDAARAGLGVATLAAFLVEEDVRLARRGHAAWNRAEQGVVSAGARAASVSSTTRRGPGGRGGGGPVVARAALPGAW